MFFDGIVASLLVLPNGAADNRQARTKRSFGRAMSGSSAGCAALRATQSADVDPPPRCRGREASATTSDYAISAYLPQSVIIDNSQLILLAFTSRITFITDPHRPGNPDMLAVPTEITRRYETQLAQQNILTGQRPHYHKWLRYYLDFL